MRFGRAMRAIMVLLPALGCASAAQAQPAPWPGDKPAATSAPPQIGPAPFPPAQGAAPPPFPPAQGSAPPPFPPAQASAPGGGFSASPGMNPGMGVPGGMSGGPPPAAGGGAAGAPPCFVEFQKLRGETEKRGLAAKSGNERKVAREEMCKLIEAYASAEAKWVNYAVQVEKTCGIPKEAITQLKASNTRSQTIRKQICATPVAGGGGGGSDAPSLSEALGTTRLPTPETTRTGRGTFDTLTGNPLTR